MKLHASSTQQYQTVTGYADNGVEINAQLVSHSLIVLPEVPPQAWDVTAFDQLTGDLPRVTAANIFAIGATLFLAIIGPAAIVIVVP